ERALHELWSILKITRIDSGEQGGARWDLLYRWSPEAVKKGAQISVTEALSALLGKYLESLGAAAQEDIEQFFSMLASRSKIRDALHALLATRDLSFVNAGP